MIKNRRHLLEAKTDSQEWFDDFEYNGEKYHVLGVYSHTRDYNWQEILIKDNHYNVVAYGKYKWLNRPWYRFAFEPAVKIAMNDLLGFKNTPNELNENNCYNVNELIQAYLKYAEEHKEDLK